MRVAHQGGPCVVRSHCEVPTHQFAPYSVAPSKQRACWGQPALPLMVLVGRLVETFGWLINLAGQSVGHAPMQKNQPRPQENAPVHARFAGRALTQERHDGLERLVGAA
jgi:hypothetical protein